MQLGELVPLLISSSTGNIGERGLCKMIYITCFVYDFDGLQCACLTGAIWHGALSQRSSMTVLYGSRRGRKGGGGGCSEIEAPALSIITTKIFLQAQLSSHFPQSFTLNHLGVQVSAVRPRQPCACSPLPLPLPVLSLSQPPVCLLACLDELL